MCVRVLGYAAQEVIHAGAATSGGPRWCAVRRIIVEHHQIIAATAPHHDRVPARVVQQQWIGIGHYPSHVHLLVVVRDNQTILSRILIWLFPEDGASLHARCADSCHRVLSHNSQHRAIQRCIEFRVSSHHSCRRPLGLAVGVKFDDAHGRVVARHRDTIAKVNSAESG